MQPFNTQETIFFDDFTSNELDRDKWNVEITGEIHNNEQQAYIDSRETIFLQQGLDTANGVLVIQPRYRQGYVTPQGNVFDFVSGRINTRNKIEFTYGSISARIQLPVGGGLWPAFWMLGINGPWPSCGELDIMEYVGETDWTSVAVHGPGYSGETPLVNKKYFLPPDDAARWHIYTLDWRPDRLCFKIDGDLVYRVNHPTVEFLGNWVFNGSQYLILNFALGGTYPFKTNGIHTPYYGIPAVTVEAIRNDEIKLLVDWVKDNKNRHTHPQKAHRRKFVMAQYVQPVFIRETQAKFSGKKVSGEFVDLFTEKFYKINNYDAMPPFFMSLVSSFDHWLFISSTGGLTAGRVNIERALFPYYTEDKLTENSGSTGCKTILLVRRGGRKWLWNPFSIQEQSQYDTQRNLFKNIPGTTLVFEEINHSLGLTYRHAWQTGDRFGFVKTSWLLNGDSPCDVEILDGLQNILPANAPSNIQNTLSCLLDAYKRNELEPETGLGVFSLSSTLTDLAEPSESLLANTVAQVGLEPVTYLLSSAQVENFRAGREIFSESEVRGQRGAYFVHTRVDIPPNLEYSWHMIADVNQDNGDVVQLLEKLKGNHDSIKKEIETDIAENNRKLIQLVGGADGLQHSDNQLITGHHFANVTFNIMRGGIFADQYWIDTANFLKFIQIQNRSLYSVISESIKQLPARIHLSALREFAQKYGRDDLNRLTFAYLPLTFSRRHGDPSRPWNRFAILIKNQDGSQRLDYEGNWRDIFQNWEALACSYPEFIENMITVFLNATTVDGYNPYRITRAGIDWEKPEPTNPWANIGYWSDHQIIYLQKLMELSKKFHPGTLEDILDRSFFSYANVPYRIKPYESVQNDPYNTIVFDWDLDEEIQKRVGKVGSDGRLVLVDDRVYHVTLAEKLLTLLLAKLVNFVPEGGIWMNTQRPEWNDANNALVGKGLSVVTLGYLRRFVVFFRELIIGNEAGLLVVSREISGFVEKMANIMTEFQPLLKSAFSDEQRRQMMDALGKAGSEFRWSFYRDGLSGDKVSIHCSDIEQLLQTALAFIEHSLRANKRPDDLYHSYNTMLFIDQTAYIRNLDEMLEGQVAILSSGLLSGSEVLNLLQKLRKSPLYRVDQHSYILYPDKELPGFLKKNTISAQQVEKLKLVEALANANDKRLIYRDMKGNYHFNGQFRNVKDVNRALNALASDPDYATLVYEESDSIKALFESTFHHERFTGRSGTFFAYEGLGSIYWHMVSKLLLAVLENVLRFRDENIGKSLREAYMDIRLGLGFNKPPDCYGAIPVDPYSHTPKGKGAKQPGMTGLVKEEILTRQVEMGLLIEAGQLVFDSVLLDKQELLKSPGVFTYLDVHGKTKRVDLKTGSLAFTFCQVPIIVRVGDKASINIHFTNGHHDSIEGNVLDKKTSRNIFQRDRVVDRLEVLIPK